MLSSGHLPLFIRKGCSHVRMEAGQPRLPGVCVKKSGGLKEEVGEEMYFKRVDRNCE